MDRVVLPQLPINEYFKDIDQYYDIHFCGIDEIDEVVDFIDQYWKKDHILVLSRNLLDWQHFDKVNGRYNFVVARHKETSEIHAILGFVPTSQFDENIEYKEVWPCIWKSISSIKGLGKSLYVYLTKNLSIETISIIGASDIAAHIYKKWNFVVSEMSNYYILNKNIENYSLLEIIKPDLRERAIVDFYSNSKKIVILIKNIFKEHMKCLKLPRYKSIKYYINRFFDHPIYKYESLGVFDNNRCIAIFFIRECEYQNSKALRIVDFIGDQSAIVGLNAEFMKLLYERNAEYVDFLQFGWDRNILEKSGFVKKDNESIVLPNYYEPFELSNTDIKCAFKIVNRNVSIVAYKSDADQDRPNMLPE
jgi:hypothetical protein